MRPYCYDGLNVTVLPMPISPHVLRKLQEALGPEAAEALVSSMENTDANRGDVAELRHEVQLGFARLDARFAGMDARFAAVETLIEKRGGALESRIGGIEVLVEKRVAGVEALVERRSADLIKWSFVFWVTAVGAIAALAGVLRQ